MGGARRRHARARHGAALPRSGRPRRRRIAAGPGSGRDRRLRPIRGGGPLDVHRARRLLAATCCSTPTPRAGGGLVCGCGARSTSPRSSAAGLPEATSGAFSVADWHDADRRRELWAGLQVRSARAGRPCREAAASKRSCSRTWPRAASRRRWPRCESLLAPADATHAAVALCLDIGHQCVVGTGGDDRDPYAWLRRLGAHAPVVHLQQSDADADHHWPFTAERQRAGAGSPPIAFWTRLTRRARARSPWCSR